MTAPPAQPTAARTLFLAARVEGFDSPSDVLHARVTYPAETAADDRARDTGIVRAAGGEGPYPVVIILNGVNCSPDGYRWLAERLAARGYVAASFGWIAEVPPGAPAAMLPGTAERTLRPGSAAQPSPAITALCRLLREQNTAGPLAGTIDMARIVLVGHSAGGREALVGANRTRHPGVIGAFSYAAHNAGAVSRGWPPATVAPLDPTCPVFICAGQRDGVLSWSRRRYGVPDGQRWDPVARTFEEALPGDTPAYHAVIRDGSHLCALDPVDPTTARGFLEPDSPDQTAPRQALAALVEGFVEWCARSTPDALLQALADPHLASVRGRHVPVPGF